MAPTHVLRCCQRGLAWIPVIFIALVVCWSYYAYVVELCICNFPPPVVYLIFFHLSFVMFVWSYWKTIFTKPANPSKEFCLPKAEKERYEKEERPESQQEILWRAASSLPLYTRTGAGAIRYCDRCQVIKPDRCHHCSACDMCVLKMDHHCPWVNNCVGFSNYKFFILFLAYSLVYCLFIAATVLQYFIKFWTNELTDTPAKFHVLFLFFVAAMFCISILSLFSYHLWLVGKNRSTIEAFRAPVFRTGSDKNGFSLGFRKNIAQVFGDQKKYWLLPVFTSESVLLLKASQVHQDLEIQSCSEESLEQLFLVCFWVFREAVHDVEMHRFTLESHVVSFFNEYMRNNDLHLLRWMLPNKPGLSCRRLHHTVNPCTTRKTLTRFWVDFFFFNPSEHKMAHLHFVDYPSTKKVLLFFLLFKQKKV
uniref:Palmitoyltransferase n=1 Tax=Neolamprologus brichardi TaxID=32507 RepID=A0A3Q4G1G1_NEOBR